MLTMNNSIHGLVELFAQLGLPGDDAGIQPFLVAHTPLAPDMALADAPFWGEAQATFLREQILDDADWAEVVDQLNLALRVRPEVGT